MGRTGAHQSSKKASLSTKHRKIKERDVRGKSTRRKKEKKPPGKEKGKTMNGEWHQVSAV